MALVNIPGGFFVPIGPCLLTRDESNPANLGVGATMDAANEALIIIGRVATTDGGSHTIDTTGSSAIGWRTGLVTFANAATTVKVGLAAVDTANGPPARAVNVANVITFDVSRSMVGGGGGITANAWQTHVPTAGTKTIANGDLVAFCVQMTARGGTDSVAGNLPASAFAHHRPTVTAYTGAAYQAQTVVPNIIITFSDGALGYFHGSDVGSSFGSRTWSSTDGTKEYGQLFNFPFPMKIYGAYGWTDADNDFSVVLYSVPLSASPVAEGTVSIDSNAVAADAFSRKFAELFSSPYSYSANTDIVIAFKPGATGITVSYKTLNNAGHRVADAWGTSGYGVSRATAAFANANSSLDHYYIGLIASAFDGGGGGRAVQINNDSLIA